jgi:glycolate oxidase
VGAAYECDAFTAVKSAPVAVVFPLSTQEVSAVVRYCVANGVPYTPRGAGTGLSGGATPTSGGVVVSLKRMAQILEVDLPNRRLHAQCGATNAQLTKAVEKHGFHFAPDPSSQKVSTLGGNIAENAGGPHTLKYGVTSSHVLQATVVDPTGEILVLGGKVPGAPGYDLLGLFIGSEGTMGIATEAWVKLTPNPQKVETALAFFNAPRDATQSVADMIAAGVVPPALEYLDATFMRVVSEAFGLVFPDGAKAFLLMEFDGTEASVARELEAAVAVCREHGTLDLRVAQSAAERDKLWFARKNAVGALGRLAPSKVSHDGVIPRSKLPDMLEFVDALAARRGMIIANLSHAGDGNLHPCMPYDDRDPADTERVKEAGAEVLRECVRLGGSLTGEHGIGIEKRDLMRLMYNDLDLAYQAEAWSILGGTGLCNPGKLLPEAGR